jgi:hypothetical protein
MTDIFTPVEGRFANEVALGKSQAAAYRIANPKSTRWKDGSVYMKDSLMTLTILYVLNLTTCS